MEWNLITTPDFQLSIANNPQEVFAGQPATYAGTIWAQNGYSSSVNLACAARATSAPQNCLASPASVTPTVQGNSFTLLASDVPNDYSFTLRATGTDSAALTRTLPVVLHIVDFGLGVPTPGSITVAPRTSSVPVSFGVSAAGSFTGVVTLSCGGQPVDITCQFQPSSASPTAGNPIAVTVTMTASSAAALGSFQIAISGATPGAVTKTQVLTVTVAALSDYALAVANPSLSAAVNATAVFHGTITAVNGYNTTVALSCGAGAPATCTTSPATVVPSSSGAPFTVTVSSASAQPYAFNINGVDAASTTHSAQVTFTALPNQNFDFAMSASPGSVPVVRGKSALFTLAVDPNTGTFPGTVSFSCAGLPALTSCSFNPAQVPRGTGNSAITASVTTTAPTSTRAALVLSLPLAAILLTPFTVNRRRKLSRALLFAGLALTLLSCGGGLQGSNGRSGGGGGSPGTKAGDYTITFTATCGAVTHSTPVTLTVTP